jgi:hypothetical protein
MGLMWFVKTAVGLLIGFALGRTMHSRSRRNKIDRMRLLPEMEAMDALAQMVFLAGGYRAHLLHRGPGKAPTPAPPQKVVEKVRALLQARLDPVLRIASVLEMDPVTTPTDSLIAAVAQLRERADSVDQRRFWDNERQELEEALLLPGHRARMLCEVSLQPQWPGGNPPTRISSVRGGFKDGRGYAYPTPTYLLHTSLRVDVVQMLGRWYWVSYVAQAAALAGAETLPEVG